MYVPILKQGGDTNTIAVVNGIEKVIKDLRGHPLAIEDLTSSSISLFCS